MIYITHEQPEHQEMRESEVGAPWRADQDGMSATTRKTKRRLRVIGCLFVILTGCDRVDSNAPLHPVHVTPPKSSSFLCGGSAKIVPEAVAASPEWQRFVREMNVGMKKMMVDMHAPGYTGDPDADFLAMMIPHHEGAVEMARLELIHGKDPLTRRLAEDIIASQTAEIHAMRQRLAILPKGGDASPDGFPALDGTRGTKPLSNNSPLPTR